jgi:hypothetical protein
MIASIDVPFLALVLVAAAIELRRPRAGPQVLLVLGVAGLLRPEAWLLSGAYLLWVLPAAAGRRRAELVAVAAAPPLLWVLSDLWITGDALWSLHQARATARRLGEYESPLGTLAWTARSWKGLLHAVPAVAALAGLAFAVRELRRRAAVEPVIGHLKDGHRMDRNFLAGRTGDAANAILAAVGYNFRLLLAWFRQLWRALLASFAQLAYQPSRDLQPSRTGQVAG